MTNIIKMQLLKTGLALFCLLLANGLTNFAISLEFLKETGSSISFGLGLIIGPITGVIVAGLLMKVIDKYPKKTLSLIGITGVALTSLLFILLLFFTTFPFSLIAIAYLSFTGVFIR